MRTLYDELNVFYLAHRRCGALTSGVYGEDGVWMACSCGASVLASERDEPKPVEPESGARGE